jgi:hypothetical protein
MRPSFRALFKYPESPAGWIVARRKKHVAALFTKMLFEPAISPPNHFAYLKDYVSFYQ